MFHQLSRASGRLIAATHLQSPLFPVTPIALQRVEPPAIKYNTNQFATVAEACPAPGSRRIDPSTGKPYPPVPEHIKKRQELFQRENDVPVFLKGGPTDAILYRLTMMLCVVGVAGVFHTIWLHAYPRNH